jgi:hypothetical protein
MNAIVQLLLSYFGHKMNEVNFEWEKLSKEDQSIFINKPNFEIVKREYEIFKQRR